VRIRIRVFRALDDPEACQRFAEGHQKVLGAYGVQGVTSAARGWMENPSVYGVIAESMEGGQTFGGVRVHGYHPDFPLPLETAAVRFDRRVQDRLRQCAQGRTAELCALWNSKEVAGMGVGTLWLMRAGISLTRGLNIDSLFALCAQHTLQICLSKGFCVDASVGDQGMFPYPQADMISLLLFMAEPELLPHAEAEERASIWSLREHPVQVRQEITARGLADVRYELSIASSDQGQFSRGPGNALERTG
jgi:hypothetical protein